MIVYAFVLLAVVLGATLIWLMADWKFRIREKLARRKRRLARERSRVAAKGKIVGRPPIN